VPEALATETETAMALGIFGSPSFVDGEVFWATTGGRMWWRRTEHLG
jgi:2-hydroxychromene-2-carboxylate isomerase